MAFGYELHPHTADIRISLWAETFPELFQAAVVALAEILFPQGCEGQPLVVRRRVAVTAPDSTALLVDFLSEVLLYSQIRKALFCRFCPQSVQETFVEGKLRGCRVEGFQQDIKAVTYHEAEVYRLSQGYGARLIVDV